MQTKTRNEARVIAGFRSGAPYPLGLCRMNAPYAAVYAFTEAKGGGVNIGEFLSAREVEEDLHYDRFTGYVDLKNGGHHTLRPGCRCSWENGRINQQKENHG